MLAAVDLDQFAQARAPRSRLVDLRRTLAARHPQAGGRHEPTHRFLRQANAMTFIQLLAGQRRPEICVALTGDRDGSVAVTRSAMMCGTTRTTESSMKTLNPAVARVLKRLHYPLDVILTCVRWYVAYPLSLRHLEGHDG
jgi:hypothetical protein